MKRYFQYILTAFILLTINTNAVSQDSTYLTMSSEWQKLYLFGSNGTHQGVKMVVDQQGNIYVISLKQQYDRKMIAIIVKLDSKGEVLWENSISPHPKASLMGLLVNATAISIDHDGNIIVLGSLHWGGIFTSQGTTTMVSHFFENEEHCYIAKYKPDGELLMTKTFHPGEGQYQLNSINIDQKGNIYFCGTLSIGVDYGNNSHGFDPSILIGMLNNTGDLEWHHVFNSKGRDVGISSVIDTRGDFYIGGVFDEPLQIGDDSLISPIKGRNSFVAKFNRKGKLKWTFMPEKMGYALSALAIDKNDKLYVSGEYWDTLQFSNNSEYIVSNKKRGRNIFVASFNKKGKVVWLKNITDEWKVYSYDGIEQMKIGEDGHLYISGGALAISMKIDETRIDGIEMTYGKEAMHSEGFIIKYDVGGNPHWLRIISGKSNQIITDFMVNRNSDIILGGSSVAELIFKNQISEKKGSLVFMAEVKNSSLSDTGPDKSMLAIQKEKLRRKSIDSEDCTCEEYGKIMKGSRNYVPIDEFITDSVFKNVTGYLGIDTTSILNGAFAFNIQSKYSSHVWQGSKTMSIHAFDPIRFRPSGNAVLFDLLPCKLMEGSRIIPFRFYYRIYIKDHIRSFDEEDFNGLGPEYYEIALELSQLNSEDMLSNLIWDEYEDRYQDELQHFADHLELKLDFELDVDSFEISLYNQVANSEKEIDMYDEIYNFYLKPLEGPGGKVTPEFEVVFSNIFYSDNKTYSVSRIDNLISPTYRATLGLTRIKIEFSDKLINSESPWAMLKIEELSWSNEDGIDIDFREMDQFCMKPFAIGNSGVYVSISKAFPDLSITDNAFATSYRYYKPYFSYRHIDKIPPEFTGILVKKCDIKIPIENTTINAIGVDLLISNNEINGWIEVEPSDKFTSDEIVKKLTELNFSDVIVIENDKKWTFFFSYKSRL